VVMGVEREGEGMGMGWCDRVCVTTLPTAYIRQAATKPCGCVAAWVQQSGGTRGPFYSQARVPSERHDPVQLLIHGRCLHLGYRGKPRQGYEALQTGIQQLAHNGQGWTWVEPPNEGYALHLNIVTHHASRTTHHAPRTTHHAPRTKHHAPSTTHQAPRTKHHATAGTRF
jgi:hypothetical protein